MLFQLYYHNKILVLVWLIFESNLDIMGKGQSTCPMMREVSFKTLPNVNVNVRDPSHDKNLANSLISLIFHPKFKNCNIKSELK